MRPEPVAATPAHALRGREPLPGQVLTEPRRLPLPAPQWALEIGTWNGREQETQSSPIINGARTKHEQQVSEAAYRHFAQKVGHDIVTDERSIRCGGTLMSTEVDRSPIGLWDTYLSKSQKFTSASPLTPIIAELLASTSPRRSC